MTRKVEEPYSDDLHRKFEGDWEPLIPLIIEAVKNNYPLQIDLPEIEYERLRAGGLDELCKDLPREVARMLYLTGPTVAVENPVLYVLRMAGTCSGCS